MNLVAHSKYKRIPNYRDLTPEQEWELLENHYNRVTDTCIPEEEAFDDCRNIYMLNGIQKNGQSFLPHEFLYKTVFKRRLETIL